MEGRKLNIDVAGRIAELQSALRDFELKTKLFRVLLQGKGLEFDGFRVFSAQDDASFIDWKASKRANKMLVKQYVEERDLSIVFVIDVGEHMVFGSTEKLKCEYAVEVAASLTNLMIATRDKVGFLLFNDSVKEFIPPKRGKNHFYFCVDTLANSLTYGGKSDLSSALNYLIDFVHKPVTSIVIISDFLNYNKKLDSLMRLVGAKFEAIAIMIKDPLDKTLPNVHAQIVMEDPSSGEQMLVEPRLAKLKYEHYSLEQENQVKAVLRQSGIDLLQLSTDVPFVPRLAEFLRFRVKKGAAF